MRKNTPYSRHWSFYAPAFGALQLWRVVVVMIAFEAIFELTPYMFAGAVPDFSGAGVPDVTPVDTLLDFGMFIVPGLGLLALVKVLHGRGFWSLVGPRDIALRDLKRAFWGVLIVLALQEPVWIWIEWDQIAEVRALDRWLIWIIPGLIVLSIQVVTEELYFRGYLQQQLAALNSSRWVWMAIPSTFFGLAHFFNGATVAEGTVYAFWAGLLGVACADVTARSGSLGAAVGLHLANNAIAMFLIGVKGWPATGLVLFLYPYEDPFPMDEMPLDIGVDVVVGMIVATFGVWIMWMAARVAIRL